MKSFVFNTSKSIINELGALKRIGNICREQAISRPLIITDSGIVQLGMLSMLEDALDSADMPYCSFTGVVADPHEAIVYEAVEQAKSQGVDGIIGLGGGSSMDTAKLVALMAKSGEKLADIYGVEQVKGHRLPLILIPTTAGTGSEVTAVAIVTTGETTKIGVVSSQLYPDVAVLDAELTVGLPPHITAMTGVDAMVHAIEAYTSIHKKNLYSDMLARESLRLLSANIQQATHNGTDIVARQAMLLGACIAGQAFANSPVAAVHALAYPLGGYYHLPHGLSNSLMLPSVLRFNASEAKDWYAELAEIVIPSEKLADTAALKCEQFIDYLVELIEDLKLPATLKEAGVSESDLPMLAEAAMLQQRLLVNNPSPVNEGDALKIYRAAYK
ncbi:MAG: iron-containing alcohol dehydrogenase [Pseudomonadales bacterium]